MKVQRRRARAQHNDVPRDNVNVQRTQGNTERDSPHESPTKKLKTIQFIDERKQLCDEKEAKENSSPQTTTQREFLTFSSN